MYAAAETCVEQVQQNDMQAEASGADVRTGDGCRGGGRRHRRAADGVDHNQESMTRLEREMADSSSRTEDLQGQMDALTRRTEEIDRRTQELTGELEGWMQQLQSMTQRAGSAVREAEVLRAREALATALPPMEGRSCQDWRPSLRRPAPDWRRWAVSWSSCRSAAKPRRAQQRRTVRRLEEAREEAAAAENVIQGHGLKWAGDSAGRRKAPSSGSS